MKVLLQILFLLFCIGCQKPVQNAEVIFRINKDSIISTS